MNHTLKSITLAAAASLAVVAHAGEKEMLDLLVKKGTITAEERGKLLEESKAKSAASGVDRVFPKEDATKRLTISGYFQTQYEGFDFSDNLGTQAPVQNGFIMRRLYLELLADVGEGLSGNVVFDMSGKTANNVDRAMVSIAKSWGTLDVGYRKVAWGYEESTLSSLFKASSSKLLTVERGITNRYWNEQASSSGLLGFGAHHTGLHYSSVSTPQGLEYGVSLVNASQGTMTGNKGNNDLAVFANVVWNNKVSDNEKYAAGLNFGRARAWDGASANTTDTLTGYNPFILAQYFAWTGYVEYLTTKIDSPTAASARTPAGYNATVVYKFNDNYEAVARYTNLDTDGRGQKISEVVRDSSFTTGNGGSLFDKSNAYYLGLNYYFTLSAAGTPVYGPNAKIQVGVERAKFSDKLSALNGTVSAGSATVDTLRAQFQVAF